MSQFLFGRSVCPSVECSLRRQKLCARSFVLISAVWSAQGRMRLMGLRLTWPVRPTVLLVVITPLGFLLACHFLGFSHAEMLTGARSLTRAKGRWQPVSLARCQRKFPTRILPLNKPFLFLAKLAANYSSNSTVGQQIFTGLVPGSGPCYPSAAPGGSSSRKAASICKHSTARCLPDPLTIAAGPVLLFFQLVNVWVADNLGWGTLYGWVKKMLNGPEAERLVGAGILHSSLWRCLCGWNPDGALLCDYFWRTWVTAVPNLTSFQPVFLLVNRKCQVLLVVVGCLLLWVIYFSPSLGNAAPLYSLIGYQSETTRAREHEILMCNE